MSESYIEYQEERFYSLIRMSVLLVLTFLSFLISSNIFPKIQLVQLVLGGLMILSLVYHAFITYMPGKFIMIRKNLLLLMDFVILTFLINVLGEQGIYLLPLYALIVMQSSVSYGLNYYVSGALMAVASLAYLAMMSPYWEGQYNVIVAFGITTLLVPLFYIKTLIRMDKKIGEAEEKIAYVDELEEQASVEFTGIKDRNAYKETIKGLIKKKEPFTLLFISLQQIVEGKEDDTISHTLLQTIIDEINKVLTEDDFFARLNDNEFVIISRKQRVFLRKYLQKLENVIVSTHRGVNGKSIHIEPNIGVTLYPEDGQNEMILGKCADDAMKAAKEKESVHHMFYRGLTS
ncbi:diguanylate cyclase [Sulfurovum sp.]|uniref:GGDEF domain-containing protein n=1 Tax=Sulfurovum sp. TaxID=1969726 RepID=UPI0025EDE186|nr:diguanylate cyclase [Sulfurovum sp.]